VWTRSGVYVLQGQKQIINTENPVYTMQGSVAQQGVLRSHEGAALVRRA
jgi:hypothetical protein